MPRRSRLDEFKPVIDVWLRDDLDASRKQRHTAKRIFDRLLEEHEAGTRILYQMVQAYGSEWREQIRIERGRGVSNVFIPRTHAPGAEAQVDNSYSPAVRSSIICSGTRNDKDQVLAARLDYLRRTALPADIAGACRRQYAYPRDQHQAQRSEDAIRAKAHAEGISLAPANRPP
jgi:hypothetical protein